MEGSWGGLLQQLARKSLTEQMTPGHSASGILGKAAHQPASQPSFKVRLHCRSFSSHVT